ncbi:sulfatase-like hydrolase/transferase [Cytophagaceae bacterium YF14B1]|uniref:Sulfatase-like hydrolase/transferase n=1 Tax=Xanthocytophaga flava TaxID=3048013 RepID=A0AAE3QN48_9BACT|nr:sulfatase-like hydrolase/transferase [Xanthocytophaga flavus]MDJ1479784.1 sulfatase-like hydrolase/transferase [Xanthocytophaga flavus]
MSNLKNILCVLLVIVTLTVQAQKQTDRPNILWIVSEDNTTLLHCYGDEFATTPNLDKLAKEGVRYTNAFSTAPVCAPSRFTLITGMYPPAMGTEHMRSTYPVPDFVKFFPRYLRDAGYYTTNNAKKDYNTVDQLETWDESSDKASYKNRKAGQPFFAVFNLNVSHESSIHRYKDSLHHDPNKVPLPPYHPPTTEFKHDWAQYYDQIEAMDAQAGKLLQQLKEEGLDENTIVFYYSDNGGVLGRSKRFMYESGLHIPLIIRFPKKYAHLASGKAGTSTDRLVTFLDFAPTILSLLNIPVPEYLQGQAFLGGQQKAPRQYAFTFRGRMDECIDMVRSVRDKKYHYIRNYLPHKIYGQHLDYLWKAPSMQSWEREYKAGRLNEVQSRFWLPKPAEELYDIEDDPHNITNLASQPQYEKVLLRFREANQKYIKESKDVGFIPEAILSRKATQGPLYTYARTDDFSLDKIQETADWASSRNLKYKDGLIKRLTDADPVVKYWAATGCVVLKEAGAAAKVQLTALLNDAEPAVQIAAAEALFHTGEKDSAIKTLIKSLEDPNEFVRLQALNVLQTFGQDAIPAIPVAKKLIPEKPADTYDVRAARNFTEAFVR